tara:strand:- start:109192 stop:111432 length:2241 start_codon:yes stop_codon:yes gene_type:complete
MNNLGKNILRYTVIAIGIAIVLFSFYLAGQTVPFKITSLLREGHPVRIEYEEYERNYDDEKFVWLILEKSDPFTENEMSKYGRMVRTFYSGMGGIESVEGIENAEYISFENNYFRLKPFMKDKRLSSEGRAALKDEFWKKSLINKDGTSLLFGITLTPDVKEKKEKEVLKRIVESKGEWEENFPNLKAHFIGTKVGKYYFLKEMIENQKKVTPLLFLFLGFLIWFLFRSFKIVFWFFFIMFSSYSSVLLMIIFLEKGLNPYSGFALFFVLIVATSDLVHFFSVFLKSNNKTLKERIDFTISKVYWPCLLTTVTTSIGFLSLLFNEMAPVFYFGIYCAFGSIICFVLTFYLLPFIILLFNIDFVLEKEIPKFNLVKTIKYVQKSPIVVLATTGLLVVVLVFFTTQLKIDDDFYNKFQDEHELSQSIKAFTKNFNFIGSVDVMVSRKEGDILDDSASGLLSKLENELKNISGVNHIRSFQQIMDYIKRKVVDGSQGELGDSEIQEKTQSIFHLLNDYKVFNLTYVENLNEVKFTLFMETTSSNELEGLLKKINLLDQKEIYSGLKIRTMGFSSIRTFLMNNVIDNFLKSFAFSMVLIFIVFLVIFRKLSWAILAMIPNILPLIFISGSMGILGLKVESNLVLLICISLGIAVDDTIHFLWAMKRSLSQEQNLKSSVLKAFEETSDALLGTTLVFVLSFPTFFLADLKLFRQMGIFIMMALLIALLADFIILPALFSLLRGDSRGARSG